MFSTKDAQIPPLNSVYDRQVFEPGHDVQLAVVSRYHIVHLPLSPRCGLLVTAQGDLSADEAQQRMDGVGE